jgi:hypothetical protein
MGQGHGPKARTVGRLLRLLTGIALLVEGGRHAIGGGSGLLLGVSLVFLLELAFYAGLHAVISSRLASLNAWIGAVLAVTPVALVFLFGDAPGRMGTLVFVGVSLIFTAVRADGGCEVMTLPSLLMGKRTHLVCIAFSPIDWIEERAAAAKTGDR